MHVDQSADSKKRKVERHCFAGFDICLFVSVPVSVFIDIANIALLSMTLLYYQRRFVNIANLPYSTLTCLDR